MLKEIPVPAELLACLAEIHSDLGYMLDVGIDAEVEESIHSLHMRTGQLIGQIDDARFSRPQSYNAHSKGRCGASREGIRG